MGTRDEALFLQAQVMQEVQWMRVTLNGSLSFPEFLFNTLTYIPCREEWNMPGVKVNRYYIALG